MADDNTKDQKRRQKYKKHKTQTQHTSTLASSTTATNNDITEPKNQKTPLPNLSYEHPAAQEGAGGEMTVAARTGPLIGHHAG
jgi:hypothetical protein